MSVIIYDPSELNRRVRVRVRLERGELIEEEGVRDITTPTRIKNTKKEQQL